MRPPELGARIGERGFPMRSAGPQSTAANREAPVELTVIAFIGIIGGACLTAALGALVAPGAADPWYQSLSRAPGNPPGFVFGAVWPLLYTLMAIGACRVWLKAGSWRKADNALGIYFLQLMVTLGWSVLFFHFHLALAALIDIAALWLLTLLMILEFHRHSPLAAQLQYPYLAWLTFAGYLNAWVVFAN
jgi:tryptophan-rich sensory protein